MAGCSEFMSVVCCLLVVVLFDLLGLLLFLFFFVIFAIDNYSMKKKVFAIGFPLCMHARKRVKAQKEPIDD